MPCIRRIRIDSGGSGELVDLRLHRRALLGVGTLTVPAATGVPGEKRRSPGTAYHLIAICIRLNAKSASTASARSAGR